VGLFVEYRQTLPILILSQISCAAQYLYNTQLARGFTIRKKPDLRLHRKVSKPYVRLRAHARDELLKKNMAGQHRAELFLKQQFGLSGLKGL